MGLLNEIDINDFRAACQSKESGQADLSANFGEKSSCWKLWAGARLPNGHSPPQWR